MLDTQQVEKYWRKQTANAGNPCHYRNYWQDRYAFTVRSRAFKREDFGGAARIVDVGCGIGEYTSLIARLTDASIIGFDFPFNIAIAKRENNDPRIEYRDGSLPSEAISAAVEEADAVVLTTVYVHLSREARDALLKSIQKMRSGARVVLLEYMPNTIPDFQKRLAYKEVETSEQVMEAFEKAGLSIEALRHVNYLDSLLFYYLGKNAVSYHLTLLLENILRLVRYPRSKYKLLVFSHK